MYHAGRGMYKVAVAHIEGGEEAIPGFCLDKLPEFITVDSFVAEQPGAHMVAFMESHGSGDFSTRPVML